MPTTPIAFFAGNTCWNGLPALCNVPCVRRIPESIMGKGGWQPLFFFVSILALFHRQRKPGKEAFIIYSQIVFLYLSYFPFWWVLHSLPSAYHARCAKQREGCRGQFSLFSLQKWCKRSAKSSKSNNLNCTTTVQSCIIGWVFIWGKVCFAQSTPRPLRVFLWKIT